MTRLTGNKLYLQTRTSIRDKEQHVIMMNVLINNPKSVYK